MWPDRPSLERSCAHIAAFVSSLRVVDDDALLQACRILETRGQSCAGTCFQAQVVQTWIRCQAGDGGSVSLTNKNVEHHWFPQRIVRICQETRKKAQSHFKSYRAESEAAELLELCFVTIWNSLLLSNIHQPQHVNCSPHSSCNLFHFINHYTMARLHAAA